MKSGACFGAWTLALVCLCCAACSTIRPQRGGTVSTTLGGTSSPTSVTTTAPENPKTPSSTTVEKTTTREFSPATPLPTTTPARVKKARHAVPSGAAAPAPESAEPAAAPAQLLRETVTERATTELGTAQKDTAREIGARLVNMRGVMWAGVFLLIAGPVVGWKMGWFTNGCIAAGVGLLLIILAQVLPGNEAWLGLGGLLLIPLVAYVYYRAHHDASHPAPPPPPSV